MFTDANTNENFEYEPLKRLKALQVADFTKNYLNLIGTLDDKLLMETLCSYFA